MDHPISVICTLTVRQVWHVFSVHQGEGEKSHIVVLWISLTTAQLYIGEACWAFLFGVVIGPRSTLSQVLPPFDADKFTGPHGANIFNPRGWGNGDQHVNNEITLEFTRVVLAIGVFAIGVELPKAYMAKHWKSLLILLGPVMTWVRVLLIN